LVLPLVLHGFGPSQPQFGLVRRAARPQHARQAEHPLDVTGLGGTAEPLFGRRQVLAVLGEVPQVGERRDAAVLGGLAVPSRGLAEVRLDA